MAEAHPEVTFAPEVRAFLEEGTRTGVVAWAGATGQPYAAPVWFVVEQDVLLFTTMADSAKAKAMRRDPRIALTAQLSEPPYAYVQVRGIAELIEDLAEVRRVATLAGGRYMGQDRAEEFGERNGQPGEVVVRLRPTTVTAMLDVTAT
ncbi:putative F420-dependent enzyme [Segniliparus rotundus DSM 44985]|uniref:Putative F420-dependent enzyme n=1 Tax=Segniliparus rotundus (strain ATCC BAA-972 / CDC 1076 / CIP 108378 / DSM 44985 / JCM 13578) TaxID=640132 RepID=D6ZAJ0_SEGRD|nr:PPOX class F420-dependent oxidoreductase [Segniliparus rotundus]ADG96732.1 putative F420-dependent enzyme [Segniliparus rotundus DSM 44985]